MIEKRFSPFTKTNIEDPPDVVEFSISVDDLVLGSDRIGKGMGYATRRPPASILELMEKNLAVAADYIRIKGGYCLYDPVRFSADDEKLFVGDVTFGIGRVIGRQLKGTETIAAFVCTAGAEISERAKKFTEKGDPVQAYIVDTIGSEAVEAAMDLIQGKLSAQVQKAGRRVTSRFSPGYCGWHLSAQHALFALFPERFCGVSLLESALMQPLKSVSGVIGIGRAVRRLDYPCRICELKNCYRRRTR